MARFQVFITAYNRPGPLSTLLAQLNSQAAPHSVRISVYDDGSSEPLRTETVPNVRWRRVRRNHGKKGFWRTYNALMAEAEWGPPADLYCCLPDDVTLCDNFFSSVLKYWNGITDPKKIALNLLFDDRCRRANWTGIQGELLRFGDLEAWHTGWIDCAFVCSVELFEALDWRLDAIPPERWRHSEAVSSGVGQQMSTRLVQAGHSLYSVPWSFIRLLDVPSQMNPQARAATPISDLRFNDSSGRAHAIASLASIPPRIENLRKTVASLLPQVDRLNVYLNGYASVPSFLENPKISVARSQDHGDLGDAGKFYWCEQAVGLQITCDDDIVYPSDYVEVMTRHVERYGRRAIVSLHGSILVQPFLGYFKSRQIRHCNADVETDAFVHVAGTGVAAWHADTIKLRRADFKLPNMGDIWMSVAAKRAAVPLVSVAHRKGWLKILENPDRTLYDRFRNDDQKQTAAIQAENPWFDPATYCLVRGGYILRGTNTSDHIFRQIQMAGDFYERPLLEHLAKRGRPGVWVDVGAHIGNHSIFFAALPGVRTISVEPAPALLPILRENLARNGVAAGIVVAGAMVSTSSTDGVGYLPGPPDNTGMGRVVDGLPWRVPATTLDLVCEQHLAGNPLALVKVDVEGLETDVLRGGLASIRRHRPVLAVECADAAALDRVECLLASLRYGQATRFCATPTYVWEPGA